MGDAFFFFEAGNGDSSSTDGPAFFFFGEGVADGTGDSFSRGVDEAFGVGVGVDDFFFVATALFFLRGLGVGVGVEKIFLSASPMDCSAAGNGTIVETITASAIRILINIANGLTDQVTISLNADWADLAYPVKFRP
ncbi:MAG: hypothetical protein QOJ36_149 [Verrucomicrobiota bacterium]